MRKYIGLIALLCASWSLEASPFNEQQTLKLQHDIQLLREVAASKNDLQLSNNFLNDLKNKHILLSQYFASAEVNQDNKKQVKELYKSLNQALSLHFDNFTVLNFTELNNQRATGNGVISGQIIDAQTQQPMNNHYVHLYNGFGQYTRNALTDNLGRYVFSQLEADDYYVANGSYNHYVQQFYGGTICPGGIGQGCQISELSPVTVNQDSIIENIDIALLKSGRLTGRLNMDYFYSIGRVELYDDSATLLAAHNNNHAGGDNFEFYIAPNQTGDLYLKFSADNHFTQLYDNQVCAPGCSVLNGTPINVTPYETVNLSTITLDAYAHLSGQIQVNKTTDIRNDRSSVYITDTNNTIIDTVLADLYDPSDWYSMPLPTAQYHAYTNKNGYIPQFYNLKNCDGESLTDCPQLSPTTINHDKNSQTTQIDFTLDQYGTVSGRVEDQLGSAIFPDLRVFDLNGQLISEDVYFDGYTFTVSGLPDGQYYLTAYQYGYLTTMYPDFVCPDSPGAGYCNDVPPASSIITITQNSHLIDKDITLYRGATISGHIKDTDGQTLTGHHVVLMDDQYNIIEETQSQYQGYKFRHLFPGDYYLGVRENTQFKAGLYDGIDCETFDDCLLIAATKITVENFDDYGSYDFTLKRKPALSVNLLSNKPNTQVTSGNVSLYNAQGDFITVKDVTSNNVTFYPTPGQYYIIYRNPAQTNHAEIFIDKPYGGTNCGNTCEPLDGIVLTVNNQGTTEVSLNLDAAFKVYGQIKNLGYGPYNHYADIKVYENDQITRNQTFANTYQYFFSQAQSFKIGAEFENFYSHYYDNIQCQGSDCGLNQATVINTSLNNELNIDFNLQPLNSISGRVLDPQNQPLSYFAVSLLSQDGTTVLANTDANGQYTFAGLEPGNYNIFTQAQDIYIATRNTTGTSCYFQCPYDPNVAIALGQTGHIENIDISPLEKGGVVVNNLRFLDGRIAANIYIEVYNRSNDQRVTLQRTNQSGNTGTIQLDSGEYYLIATPSLGQSSKAPDSAYPNLNCRTLSEPVCRQSATTLTVTEANKVIIDDFMIHDAGQLSVTLKDANTQNIISESRGLTIYSTDYNQYEHVNTQYGVADDIALPEGDYYLMAQPVRNSPYTAQLYPDVPCPKGIGYDCLLSQGQTFSISDNQIKDIELLLNTKPSVTIQAKDSYTNDTIKSKITIFNENTTYHLSRGQGYLYTIYLDPGNYYVIAEPDMSYQNNYNTKLYPNIECTGSNNLNHCDYFSAQPISISQSGHPPVSINLDLIWGFQGEVINGLSNTPIDNATIDFWRDLGSQGYHSNATVTNQNGRFSTPVTGQYFMSTHISNALPVFNEVYNNRHCFDGPAYLGLCDIKQGDLISNTGSNAQLQEVIFLLDGDAIFDDSFENLTP